MQVSFLAKDPVGIKETRVYKNVVAVHIRDGILHIHTIESGMRVLRKFPMAEIEEFTQAFTDREGVLYE
ncbi:MAG: hypothetical protein R3251_04185 [Candidatus Spechtbacterales bacterium]|nr:hypothetical protein [Candidatus Spechtbacterales bacterium]